MSGNTDSKDPLRWVPSKATVLIGGALGVVLIGFIDEMTGIEVSLSIIYLLPICFSAWYGGRAVGIIVACFAAAIWLTVDLWAGAVFSNRLIPLWNAMVRLGFFLLITILLDRIRLLTANLDALVRGRTLALEVEMARRRELEHEAAEITRKEGERIAHELHDQVGGNLAGIAFRAKALAENLERQSLPDAASAREVVRVLNQTMDQVRGFARLLTSPEMGNDGLDVVLSRLGEEIETTYGTSCEVTADQALPVLTSEQIRNLYRIAYEAIRNAIRHGQAKQIEVRVEHDAHSLSLSIANDGKLWEPAISISRGMGLRIIQDRTRVLGGTWSIKRNGSGRTQLLCQIPLLSEISGHLLTGPAPKAHS